MNLLGLRILNTRPLGQNEALSLAIQKAHGVAIELPTLAIEPTPTIWINNLPNLNEIDHIIFISPNAVKFFFENLPSYQINSENYPTFTAIGKATAKALSNLGIKVTNIPSISDSEHLLQLSAFNHLHNATVLIVKGEAGRTVIANELNQRAKKLITLEVYRRVLPLEFQEKAKHIWQDDLVDIILITSQQSLYNLFLLMGKEAKTWLCQKTFLVISDRLAKAALDFGIKKVITTSYETILSENLTRIL